MSQAVPALRHIHPFMVPEDHMVWGLVVVARLDRYTHEGHRLVTAGACTSRRCTNYWLVHDFGTPLVL